MVNVFVPAVSKTTAKSGSVPPVKDAATSAVGLLPTAKFVSGKVTPEGVPTKLPPVPRLFDSSDNVTGTRSPTKNVAGLLSCARIRTSRPLRTSESESEKSTLAPGSVSKNVDNPPPNRTNGGMLENPCPLKTCCALVSKFARSVELASERNAFGVNKISDVDDGGVTPNFCSVARSTSNNSIS